MADTINELYLKYVDGVGGALEDDRYFQYLFEMVQSGNNTLHQTNQVLHKVVDERWLTTIEESLDAINNIIEKPRRFITTSEEVVPVALAKKITSDSVRHLSMNTQFIASDENGDIQPTRILNVTTEESYDLYENRFIYHLIQRLVTFIDKRTDIIFWSTGDEKRNTLSMTSKVDDAYEEIEYKIEMKIKNRQSFAENDSDNMQVFMRIDRVRRLVMALRGSAFCSLMAGCSKVKSPIQRTNLLMKDPDYRTCYKLWQFLESYDEVGYKIEVQDTALAFDEEYLLQLYTNMITNYTVFKSLLEEDPRNVEEIVAEKREVLEPKFIKEVVEEIVDDYNIPDVEVRKVIIEEVTQRQLELEKELEEEKTKREEAEAARDEAEIKREQEIWQARAQQQEFAEAQAKIQQELEQKVSDTQKQLEDMIQQSKEDVEKVKAEADAEVEKTKNEADAKVRETIEASRAEVESTKAEADAEIEKTRSEADAKVRATIEASRAEVESVKAQTSAELEKTRSEADAKVRAMEEASRAEIERIREASRLELERAKEELHLELERMKEQSRLEIEEARRSEAQAKKQAEAEASRRRKLEAQEEARQAAALQKEKQQKEEEERKRIQEEERQRRRQESLQKARENVDENFKNVTEKLSRRNKNIGRKRK